MANYETLHVLIKNAWTNIRAFKDDKNKFNEEFMRFVPEIRKYIIARIRTSVQTGKLPENKYRVDDFLDELFILAYDSVEKFDSYEDYSAWLIQKLDELMEDISVEEEFNEFFFQNIENYTHEEWDAMEEDYTIGADGKCIMTEEVEDPTYPKHKYVLKDVFIEDNAEELINKISDKLDTEQIQRHIELVVNNLPVEQQKVFQQSMLLGSSLSQIAKVQSAEASKIKESLKSTRLIIQRSFVARFNF